MHLCESTRTRSCFASRAIAPVGQTCAQGAGSQCRHRLGTDMLYAHPGETWILDLGSGSSAKASAGSLLWECATAQANSHCRQPMQRSGLMNTVCMLAMANLSAFLVGSKSFSETLLPLSKLSGSQKPDNSGLYLSGSHQAFAPRARRN